LGRQNHPLALPQRQFHRKRHTYRSPSLHHQNRIRRSSLFAPAAVLKAAACFLLTTVVS
jgi:hypothetical protein